MNIIFFGSSDFSLPILDALIHSPHKVFHVVTRAPSKKGRGLQMYPSVVQMAAESCRISYSTPLDLKNAEWLAQIKLFGADCFVVASYGKMLPDELLAIPKILPLNIHPSLLPKYRGAAPIAHQLLNGERESGVTVAIITRQLDAGDIIAQEKIRIHVSDDALSLQVRLAKLGGEMLLKLLENSDLKKAKTIAQNEDDKSYAPKLTKEIGRINWNKDAENINNLIRALVPWPSAFCMFRGKRLKIRSSCVAAISQKSFEPGKVFSIDRKNGIRISSANGAIDFLVVHPESGKEMSGYDFAIGQRMKVGEKFQ